MGIAVLTAVTPLTPCVASFHLQTMTVFNAQYDVWIQPTLISCREGGRPSSAAAAQ